VVIVERAKFQACLPQDPWCGVREKAALAGEARARFARPWRDPPWQRGPVRV